MQKIVGYHKMLIIMKGRERGTCKMKKKNDNFFTE